MGRGASRLEEVGEVGHADERDAVQQITTIVAVPLLGNFPFPFVAAYCELITVRMETSFPFRRNPW